MLHPAHFLKKGLYLLLLFFYLSNAPARCLGYYNEIDLFLTEKNIYIIKVIDVDERSTDVVYKVKTIKTINGSTKDEFLIQTWYFHVVEDGFARLYKDSSYLVGLAYDKYNVAQLSHCSYYLSVTSGSFRHDSVCFESFKNKDGFVNNPYYRGRLADGKPHGKWVEYNDSGSYAHGRRIGKWIINQKPVVYKKGNWFIYEEEIYGSDSVIKHDGRRVTMKYKGKLLRTWKKKRYYNKSVIKVYEHGILVQRALFGKYDKNKRITCYENGKVIYDYKFKGEAVNTNEEYAYDGANNFFHSYFDPKKFMDKR